MVICNESTSRRPVDSRERDDLAKRWCLRDLSRLTNRGEQITTRTMCKMLPKHATRRRAEESVIARPSNLAASGSSDILHMTILLQHRITTPAYQQ